MLCTKDFVVMLHVLHNIWVDLFSKTTLMEIVQGLVAFAKAGGKGRVKEAKDMLESLKRKDIIRELCPLLQ